MARKTLIQIIKTYYLKSIVQLIFAKDFWKVIEIDQFLKGFKIVK